MSFCASRDGTSSSPSALRLRPRGDQHGRHVLRQRGAADSDILRPVPPAVLGARAAPYRACSGMEGRTGTGTPLVDAIVEFGGVMRRDLIDNMRGGRQEDGLVNHRRLACAVARYFSASKSTVKDALLHISAPSSVQNLAHTARRYHIGANQKALIETVSLIHALHMMHFWYDTKVNGVAKIGKQVPFRPELEFRLESWLAPEALG
ncbi:hypothetical protein FIBSPDRAFT_953771 [Athelia psychrophila]|uniref:Uncharacterized protein n=1 Tax=Athelia psychrophila TaxID=1759441 RepID=A0A166JVV7_9AGAM|nr:hypothetical protein FIBSPDRAFT_953771 [Fibularhizoctonia sp. CBS 109695]